ncbi:uncharacterized protein EV420DRAFT_1479660 [Desarmillaria tabescens]|uniref:Uncharacterized protein n=1 Tax=Armillaria tabescens TaxID=1929756 RepID=A0AA39N6F0_ARMTA|nr:uncharacterized protein EV420DRAFT_1479660 [Desarmillaria tabescens]KAK0459020.1 hypothetical protein EV420DRAFT_1479660 [Desarmillaria tabescens]
MAPRRGRSRAQKRGDHPEPSAVVENEAPGPTETLAVHPGGALNARFRIQGLGHNIISQPSPLPQHGQPPPPPSLHVRTTVTTPPSTRSRRHQADPANLDDDNPFASTLEYNTSHSQSQPMLGRSLVSTDTTETFNFDTLSDSSGPTTPTPILRPSAPTPKSNRQRRRAKRLTSEMPDIPDLRPFYQGTTNNNVIWSLDNIYEQLAVTSVYEASITLGSCM